MKPLLKLLLILNTLNKYIIITLTNINVYNQRKTLFKTIEYLRLRLNVAFQCSFID